MPCALLALVPLARLVWTVPERLPALDAVLAAAALLLAARGAALRRPLVWRRVLPVAATLVVGAELGRAPAVAALAAVALVFLLADRSYAGDAFRPGASRAAAALAGGVGVGFVTCALVFADPLAYGRHHHGVDALTVACALALALVGLVGVVSPEAAAEPGDAEDRRAITVLVERGPADTLAPFALRPDKSYAWSPDGRAALPYRVLAGVAVAAGDPVGEPRSHVSAMEAFLRRCLAAGWRPAVVGASAPAADTWRTLGMHPINVGDEAVIDAGPVFLAGRRNRNLRQAVQRTRNSGVTTELFHGDAVTPTLLDELAEVDRRWRRGRPELGYAMAMGNPAAVTPDQVVVVARDHDGAVAGFQRYLWAGGRRLLTLDAMPRRPDAPNGVNERMIVDVASWAGDAGVERISLNFAAMRSIVDAGADRSLRQRVAFRAMHLMDRWIGLESLYRFNAKFCPDWIPRFAVVQSWVDLPRVAVAATGLEFALPYDRRRARSRTISAERG